ncbi:unnamed protein product [Didymodactylos carnosus]|uniref:Ankyrin repeat protein n=1 Tax=Didymodactylos carnosus TaxID=1234261 RepID=A0A815N2D8_9BILA|nr:unnamed protein product [Didymodactylos carnosus]CAF1431459.1 unnamed protein product [Didymodactylos carnosus]CAF3989037.1 unnamed protein product [Didymodactylos carnosus]CAF4310061.1 unnamed protein product [Didymodactylos carnosus]
MALINYHCRLLINRQRDCLLHKAIENGHHLLASELIHAYRRTGLERKNEHGETPLLCAAKQNAQHLIQLLIEKRAEIIYDTDNEMNNVFHHLVKHGNSSATIEWLLDYLKTKLIVDVQQNFDKKNNDQLTPLDLAIKLNLVDIVSTLTLKGQFKSNDEDILSTKLNEMRLSLSDNVHIGTLES